MSSYIASESPSPPSSDWSPSPPPPETTGTCLKNGSSSEGRSQTSPSPTSLDAGGSLFWNASLLYYTGQSSPKIKQTQLRPSVSMSDMNRSISPVAKTLVKSPSNDSGTGTCGSLAAGVNNGDDSMSPLRRRHLSCGSSSTASTSSMGSLKKGKLSSSMRMMKALSKRPTLSSFMERTQSLGRSSKNKTISPDENTLDDTQSSPSKESKVTTTSSSSGLSSTAKAFRDSFRAARNLLPSSSSKVVNSIKSNSPGSLKKQFSKSSSSLHSDANESSSTINYSAPNTPKVLERSLSISSERVTEGSLSDLASGSSSFSNFPGVTTAFTTATAIIVRSSSGGVGSGSGGGESSSKTESSDVTKDWKGSKSILSTKLKRKDKEPSEKAVSSKKVSLVKSLSRMRIGRSRSKERKAEDLSPDSNKSVPESKKASLQEIVELENEPRVRTPKSVRNKRLTTSPSPYPDRDREFNEMEVSENAVEIDREDKVLEETGGSKSSEEPKSQISSQSQTSQEPSVIKVEHKKSSSGSKKKDKGSKTGGENSSAKTGTLVEDDKNSSYPDGYPPLPSTTDTTTKVKGKKAKKSSLESEQTDGKLLETKLDLEDDDPITQESGTGSRIDDDDDDEVLDSTRSPNYLQEDTNTGKDNHIEVKNNPDSKPDVVEGDVVVVQEGNINVTTGPGPDNKDLEPTASSSSAKGPEEPDEDTYCTDSFRQLKPFNYDLEPIEEGKRERLYKVLVVGELGAGKTSIIKRYVHQFFSQHYRATIGVDFALKVLRWDPDTVVRLQLWDIAGQERFGSMTRVYYKEAVGAFVVFDVTRGATLEAVPKWKADLDSKVALPDGRSIPTVLLANKSDQPKEGIAANREKMNDFCQQQGFAAWFETSAKDNINIDESANFLVSKILEMDRWSQEPLAPDPDKVDLSANGKVKPNAASDCSC